MDTTFNQSVVEDGLYLSCEGMEADLVLDHICVFVICEYRVIREQVAGLGERELSILQTALCEVLVDGEACHL